MLEIAQFPAVFIYILQFSRHNPPLRRVLARPAKASVLETTHA